MTGLVTVGPPVNHVPQSLISPLRGNSSPRPSHDLGTLEFQPLVAYLVLMGHSTLGSPTSLLL